MVCYFITCSKSYFSHSAKRLVGGLLFHHFAQNRIFLTARSVWLVVCCFITLSQTEDFPKCQAFSWCFAKLGPGQDRVGVCLCIVFCNPERHCSACLHCVLQSSMVLVCVFVLCFGTGCKM